MSTIVALLQSALLLLTMAQSTPGLPQSFRDHARSIAQEAITQATSALALGTSNATASTTTVQTFNDTFITPSGAMIDGHGQVTSPAPATYNIPPVASAANNLNVLSIILGTVTTQPTSVHLEWNTSIPTESKIFFQTSNGAAQVIPSESGNSTHHIVNLSNLISGTKYSYTIEALTQQQDQTITGSFETKPPPFEVYTVSWESGPSPDLYFWGNTQIDPRSINISYVGGSTLPWTFSVATSRSMGNDCIYISGGSNSGSNLQLSGDARVQKCGGQVMRLAPSGTVSPGTYTLIFASTGGQSYVGTLTVY